MFTKNITLKIYINKFYIFNKKILIKIIFKKIIGLTIYIYEFFIH